MGAGMTPGGVTGAQVRPLTLSTSGVVSVGDTQTTLLAANAARRGGVIQNHSSDVLQVYTTAAQAHLSGPILLPQYASVSIHQIVGSYKGAIYGIRAAGQTGNAGVIEET